MILDKIDVKNSKSFFDEIIDFNKNAFAANLIISSLDPVQIDFYEEVKNIISKTEDFDVKISKIKDIANKYKLNKISTSDFDILVRIYTIGNLIEYYAPDFMLSPNDILEFRNLLLSGDLSIINLRNWTGGGGIVWFMSIEEYESLTKRKKLGTFLNNSLALGYETGVGVNGLPEFVAISYKIDYTDKIYKPLFPDTIGGFYKDENFYFSGNDSLNEYGNTNPHSAGYLSVKEYIHEKIDLLDNYELDYIGEGKLDLNESDMIKEMEKRVS